MVVNKKLAPIRALLQSIWTKWPVLMNSKARPMIKQEPNQYLGQIFSLEIQSQSRNQHPW